MKLLSKGFLILFFGAIFSFGCSAKDSEVGRYQLFQGEALAWVNNNSGQDYKHIFLLDTKTGEVKEFKYIYDKNENYKIEGFTDVDMDSKFTKIKQ